MIKIARSEKPPFLRTSQSNTRYNDVTVKKTLWEMQHKKCCYCEKNIPLKYESEVEHFRPRKGFCELKNVWSNLLLACRSCNGAKKNQFPLLRDGNPSVIDPSDPSIDPEDHIEFLVGEQFSKEVEGNCVAKAASILGDSTIRCIDLASSDHLRARKLFYRNNFIPSYRNLLRGLKNGDTTQAEEEQARIREMLSASGEYSALVKTAAFAYALDQYGV